MKPFTLTAIAASVLATVTYPSVQAQETPSNSETVVTAPVVVTATRTEKKLNEAPSSLVVITDGQLEQDNPKTLGDALLDIPNVMMEAPDSPVFTRISIRGSDSDQITYLIDGVRQDNYTMSGNRPAFMFADPEMIKQIEVRRGGGSSLYGNGGIGGTIAVTTKTAADLLKPGRDFGAKLKAGYNNDADEFGQAAWLYGRKGPVDAVIGFSHRDGGKVISSSNGKRSKTPRNAQYDSFTSKLSFTPSDDSIFSIGYNYDENKLDQGRTDNEAKYRLKQHRLSGSWEYSSGDWVDLVVNMQYMKLDNKFDGTSYNNEAYFKDKFDSYSINTQNTSVFGLGGTHSLTYGFDASLNKQKAADVYGRPDRSRPKSKGYDAGLFIQDEYAINPYLTLTPVLRWSYYNRKPTTDNNDKFGLASRSDSKVTPGITLTLSPSKQLSFYASVQTGYRPPFLDELYTSIEYPEFGMYSVVLPNPDLKPEESINVEIGVNGDYKSLFSDSDRFVFHANVFRDRVKNLINAGATGDMDFTDDGDMILYYSIDNVGKALKTGFEASADYYPGNADFHLSYGYLHAEDKNTGEKIPGLTPMQATLRAGYTYKPWNVNGWYRMRLFKGGKSNLETAWNSGEYKQLGGFATHTLGLTWKPQIKDWADFTLTFSVDNITNKKFRYLNGGYGVGRSYRAWLSATF